MSTDSTSGSDGDDVSEEDDHVEGTGGSGRIEGSGSVSGVVEGTGGSSGAIEGTGSASGIEGG